MGARYFLKWMGLGARMGMDVRMGVCFLRCPFGFVFARSVFYDRIPTCINRIPACVNGMPTCLNGVPTYLNGIKPSFWFRVGSLCFPFGFFGVLLVSFWSPFGFLWFPFGFVLVPFGFPLVYFWLPFGFEAVWSSRSVYPSSFACWCLLLPAVPSM